MITAQVGPMHLTSSFQMSQSLTVCHCFEYRACSSVTSLPFNVCVENRGGSETWTMADSGSVWTKEWHPPRGVLFTVTTMV